MITSDGINALYKFGLWSVGDSNSPYFVEEICSKFELIIIQYFLFRSILRKR